MPHILFCSPLLATSTRPLCLIGPVFDGQGPEAVHTLLIVDGKIQEMHAGDVALSGLPNMLTLQLQPGEVMLPGFINLHVHTGYNVFPIWDGPTNAWTNRFQWRNNAQYKLAIKDFEAYIKSNWQQELAAPSPLVTSIRALMSLPAEGEQYESFTADAVVAALQEVDKAHAVIAELQAAAGGTSLVQQTLSLDTEAPDERSFIIRNTGNPADLGLGGNAKVISLVDFYKPCQADGTTPVAVSGDPGEDTRPWRPGAQSSLGEFLASVAANHPDRFATIAHLAEGRAGFLASGGVDPYSRAEFTAFWRSAAGFAREDLATANVMLTHASGVDAADPAALAFLRNNRISLIWSPVSNLLLYSDTLPVPALLSAGVNLCLGSDWSPSGSKHVWDELKFAKVLNDRLGWGIADADLYAMATANPAAGLGGLPAGRLAAGCLADLFVLRKQSPEQPPLEALFSLDDAAVRYVIVNGRVVYGAEEVFKDMLQVDYELLPATEGLHAAGKAVSINSHLQFNLTHSLHVMDLLLEAYATGTLHQPMRRPRFLSADDAPYQERIQRLQAQVDQLRPVAASSPELPLSI